MIKFWEKFNSPKTGLYIFILAVVFDIGSMLFYKQFKQSTADFIYFSGQSLSRLFYIWTILIYTKDYFIINIICAMWFGFACNDSLEELFFDNTKFDITEYIVFGISIPLIAWKIYRYKKQSRRY